MGFKNIHLETINWEDHFACEEAEEIAGGLHDQLRNSFENFQRLLRTVSLKEETARSIKKRQATLHDMFCKKS